MVLKRSKIKSGPSSLYPPIFGSKQLSCFPLPPVLRCASRSLSQKHGALLREVETRVHIEWQLSTFSPSSALCPSQRPRRCGRECAHCRSKGTVELFCFFFSHFSAVAQQGSIKASQTVCGHGLSVLTLVVFAF